MRLTALAAVAGAAVTLALTPPYLAYGIHTPSGHLVLDSIDACIGLLVAYLLHGRFVRRRRLQDLLLAQALVLLVVAGLGLSYLVHALPAVRPGTLDIWLPFSVRFAGGLLVLSAALIPARCVRSEHWRNWWPLPPLALIGALFLVLWTMRSGLPVAFDVTAHAPSTRPPLLTGHPLLLAAQGVSTLCFGVAAVLFTLQARRSTDALLTWVGPAFALGAFARLNYMLFPSLYTDWLHTGDLLRTGCYVLLLLGATREIQQFWAAQAQVAVLEDRRRLARELHDGVIQELGYIRSEAERLPVHAGSRIVGSCTRALGEVRDAVHALGADNGDESFSTMLELAARQMAERYDVQLQLELDDTVTVSEAQRHALVRITREAISNALRHGRPETVHVRLSRDTGGHVLTVHDAGEGFDVGQAQARSGSLGSGYGLVSMRDRASGLPGSFTISSEPGSGSVVTVTW